MPDGLDIALQLYMNLMRLNLLRQPQKKSDRITFLKVMPFLLMIGLSAMPSEGPWMHNVNEDLRLNHAKRLLTQQQFEVLANFKFDEGQLEAFILQTLKKKLRGNNQFNRYRVADAIIHESNEAGLDPLFVMALIQQESNFNIKAKGSFGEIGLMQIKPDTAKWISHLYKIPYRSKHDLYNPLTNIRIGVRYLSRLDNKFNRTQYSISAYNMGTKKLKNSIKAKRLPKIYFSGIIKKYSKLYSTFQVKFLLSSDRMSLMSNDSRIAKSDSAVQ